MHLRNLFSTIWLFNFKYSETNFFIFFYFDIVISLFIHQYFTPKKKNNNNEYNLNINILKEKIINKNHKS